MLLRLYNDETPLIDHSQARRQQPAPTGDAAAGAADAANAVDADGVEPETLVDEDGGVRLNADVDDDMQDVDATAPVGASGVGTEEDAMATEDRLRAEQQVIADDDSKDNAAPERKGESDTFNTTV